MTSDDEKIALNEWGLLILKDFGQYSRIGLFFADGNSIDEVNINEYYEDAYFGRFTACFLL
jgi:hypothetical protein